MADHYTRRWRDRLGIRLAAAFMATTLATVAVVTAIAWTASGTGADTLLTERREQVADDVVAALESAYLVAGGWGEADLLPAHTLAAAAGAVLIVSTPELGELPTPPDLDLTRRRLHGADDADPATSGEPGEGEIYEQPPREGPADDAQTDGEPASEDPPWQGRTEGDGAPPPDAGSGGPAPDDGRGGYEQPRSDPGEPRAAPAVTSFASWRNVPTPVWLADGPTPSAAEHTVDERRELPIVVGGDMVGTATLVFVDLDLVAPDEGFREAVARRLILGAGVALGLSLLATLFVTSRLTRPLRRLTAEVDELRGVGTTPVRPSVADAPGEIAVLSDALARMAEDLRRQERLRRALVADVEHELRTPVTILLGELEALREGILTADERQLGSLQEEVQRIARLVEDVGALADAEAAGFALDVAPIDLAAVTAAATQGLETPLAAAELELRLHLEHIQVDGDARRLEQLVRNLLTNAAKFAPPGTAIEVSVCADGNEAVLEVDDRGPGFDVDELPHVFTRFWRGSQVAGAGGSGIGLAVVDEVARAHGGAAAASNRPGGGARLTVRLPRAVHRASALGRGRSVLVDRGMDAGGATAVASTPPSGRNGG